uniref:Putative sulfotransferase n=1 Tax=Amblyomma aureolatum TaxID=187763 RepID=A0A1E1X6Y4_9ACAR
MDLESYRYVDGLWMHTVFDEDNLRSVFSYKPRPDDVFIATYPKCGTTWTQYLVLSILRKGDPPKTAVDFSLASPFLELLGAEAAEKMVRPGLLKVHLPFGKTPFSTDAKYICVTRNPYDVCVSFYYHTKGYTPKSERDVSFARFHELFITGKLSWGDYFDHLHSWYEERSRPNVLFFTYEKLKKDTISWVLKIADFLGSEYGEELRRDSTLLRKVLDTCSIENMKSVFNNSMKTLLKDLLSLSPEKSLKSVEVYRELVTQKGELHETEGFIRKGVVGDWRAHFTLEQIEKTKAWIEKKTKGSDVMRLWSDIDLP